jgi:hypothetical protein
MTYKQKKSIKKVAMTAWVLVSTVIVYSILYAFCVVQTSEAYVVVSWVGIAFAAATGGFVVVVSYVMITRELS